VGCKKKKSLMEDKPCTGGKTVHIGCLASREKTEGGGELKTLQKVLSPFFALCLLGGKDLNALSRPGKLCHIARK